MISPVRQLRFKYLDGHMRDGCLGYSYGGVIGWVGGWMDAHSQYVVKFVGQAHLQSEMLSLD